MCLQFSPGRRQASQQIPQQRHSLPYVSRRNNEKAPGQPRPTRCFLQKWRRRWDSNPRAVSPATRFRVELVMTASIRLRMIFPTSAPRIWGELMGRTKEFSKWAKPGRPCNDWVCEAHTSKMQKWFRVSPVMTTSIPLRILGYYSSILGKNQVLMGPGHGFYREWIDKPSWEYYYYYSAQSAREKGEPLWSIQLHLCRIHCCGYWSRKNTTLCGISSTP